MMAMKYVMVNDDNDILMTIFIDNGSVDRIFMMISDAPDNAVKIKNETKVYWRDKIWAHCSATTSIVHNSICPVDPFGHNAL